MASVLRLRKIPPLLCSTKYCCGIPSPGWQSVSYLKLCYILKRLKSSTKPPFGEEAGHMNNHHDEDYSKMYDANVRNSTFHSSEVNTLSDTLVQNVASVSSGDLVKPLSLPGSPLRSANSIENDCNLDQNTSISILSAKEVLESVRHNMFEGKCDSGVSGENGTLSNGKDLDVGARQHMNSSDKEKIPVIVNKIDRKTKSIYKNYKKTVRLTNKYKEENETQDFIARDTSYGISDQHRSLSNQCLQTGSVQNENTSVKTSAAKLNKNVKCLKIAGTMESNKRISSSDFPSHCENKLGIQTLSQQLQHQIFGRVKPKNPKEAEEDLQRSKEHLQHHGLWDKMPSVLPEIDLELPKFEDSDLDQHFRIVAEKQCAPYKNLLNQLVGADLPCIPSRWEYTPGWTRYNSDGTCSQVDFPDCDAVVFDVEIVMKEGSMPTLAAAVSDKYWYSWCSDSLIYPQSRLDDKIKLEYLIPLETSKLTKCVCDKKFSTPRIVVGHNVSFDRIRVGEQYLIERSSLRFVDTMSLHIAVSGLVAEQRALLLKNKASDKKIRLPWMNVGCQNNLNDVYKFYCRTKDDLEKSTRDVFVKGSLDDVREDFQKLMTYCANDVKATHMVLAKLLPQFFERCPHPVTFSGMLEMGMAFLPVTQNWNKYVEAAESEYNRVQRSLNEKLAAEAQVALSYLEGKKYEEDPWLWDLDWALPKGRVKKLPGYPKWYRKLCQRAGESEGTPKPENMSTSQQVVPKLLRLTWNGFPLHYERKYGWGYLKPLYQTLTRIPSSEILSAEDSATDSPRFPVKALYKMCCEQETRSNHQTELKKTEDFSMIHDEDYEWLPQDVPLSDNTNKQAASEEKPINIGIPGVAFFQLPHKDGAGNRVGNPLAKDFLTKIEDKTLSSHSGDIAELVLKTSKTISYWKNNRDRILSQVVICPDHASLPRTVTSASDYEKDGKYGVILPMVVTAGTITRRAVERTWMTASNAYADRIGSELKAMVEAPPGYRFVGADVDSQELWIAAVLGDAYLSAEHGATALGWMTLQGKKSDGTDMHSRTANSAGISRENAKVVNYGRIYGAGVKFMQRLLKQFNPLLSDAETKYRAEKLFATTKGQRGWYLNYKGEQMANCIDHPLNQKPLSRKEIYRMIRQARNNHMDFTFAEVVEHPPVWFGGSESHMFNCLEAIARSDKSKTPVLGARITRALEPYFVDDQFMTSRVNWVVQSSAVDYLHLLLVCMRWLFSKYEISGRFSISIHDEVRYLVPFEDCYRAALALQIANLLTRSLFALRLGFKDLPQSVAFFSGIDIDKVLRKEPHLDCITPSNPDGLMKGYGISPGVTLDILQILQATNGMLVKSYDNT